MIPTVSGSILNFQILFIFIVLFFSEWKHEYSIHLNMIYGALLYLLMSFGGEKTLFKVQCMHVP